MRVASSGLATDLVLAGWAGEVVDRGDHLVVRIPDEPDYWSGNAVVVGAAAPDLARWEAWFAAAHPSACHRTVLVDGEVAPAVAAAAAAAGYDVARLIALTATSLAPVAAPAGIALRPLTGDDDWAALHAFTLANDALAGPIDDRHRRFVTDRQRQKRAWIEAGRGAWWGGFDGERLVAALGLVDAGGLGRYQDVNTDPAYRRRGIAGALLATAGRAALDRGVRGLVIVAVAEADADRLYRRIGFAPETVATELMRRPR